MLKVKKTFILFLFLSFPLTSVLAGASGLPGSPQFGAQLRLRPEFRDNTDFKGTRNYSLLRFRANATFPLGDPEAKNFIYFQPQYAKILGDFEFTPLTTNTNNPQATSGALFDNPLTVHQAYLNYSFFPNFRLIGGRQMLFYGDGLLLGSTLVWHNIGRSFDALKWVYSTPDLQTDFFWSRLVENGGFLKGSGPGNVDLWGLYQSFKGGPSLRAVDFYILNKSDSRASSSLSLWTFGSRLKSPIDYWDYRLEMDYQVGTSASGSVFGNQVDGELGYTIPNALELRASLGGFAATSTFDQFFSAAHKWLGTADVFGRRNIAGGVLKLSGKPAADWTIFCDFFQFYKMDPNSTNYRLAGVIPIGNVGNNASSFLGNEIDGKVIYSLSEAVKLSAGVSVLWSGDAITKNLGDINPVYSFVEMEAVY